jgi:hypothetical protein
MSAEILTDRDLAQQIIEYLGPDAADYDTRAAAQDLQSQVGHYRTLEEIDEDLLTLSLQRHELPPRLSPRERFEAELVAAIEATPPGRATTWTDQGVTVEITGASRVNHRWPQVTAYITITAPGHDDTIRGEDVESWDDLWGRVSDVIDDVTGETRRLRELLRAAVRRQDRAQVEADQAGLERDTIIQLLAARSVPHTVLAEDTRLTPARVGQIVKRSAQ